MKTHKKPSTAMAEALDMVPGAGAVVGREKQLRGSGVHLNPLGLFLYTSIPCIWSIF
jgi:hypothetical protein